MTSQYPTRKLGLLNLEHYAWICVPASDVNELQSCDNLIALGLWLLKALLADGLINLRILFLKMLRLPEFIILRSRLFHCVMPDRKKYIFKNLCLVLKKGTFYILLVLILHTSSILLGLIWKDTLEIHFCRIYVSKIDFCINDVAVETSNIALHKISLLKYLLLLLLMQGKHYIGSVTISDENLHYKLDRK